MSSLGLDLRPDVLDPSLQYAGRKDASVSRGAGAAGRLHMIGGGRFADRAHESTLSRPRVSCAPRCARMPFYQRGQMHVKAVVAGFFGERVIRQRNHGDHGRAGGLCRHSKTSGSQMAMDFYSQTTWQGDTGEHAHHQRRGHIHIPSQFGAEGCGEMPCAVPCAPAAGSGCAVSCG